MIAVVYKCSIVCVGPGVNHCTEETLLECSQTWYGRQGEGQEKSKDCCYDPTVP